jgi:hypothetical protein
MHYDLSKVFTRKELFAPESDEQLRDPVLLKIGNDKSWQTRMLYRLRDVAIVGASSDKTGYQLLSESRRDALHEALQEDGHVSVKWLIFGGVATTAWAEEQLGFAAKAKDVRERVVDGMPASTTIAEGVKQAITKLCAPVEEVQGESGEDGVMSFEDAVFADLAELLDEQKKQALLLEALVRENRELAVRFLRAEETTKRIEQFTEELRTHGSPAFTALHDDLRATFSWVTSIHHELLSLKGMVQSLLTHLNLLPRVEQLLAKTDMWGGMVSFMGKSVKDFERFSVDLKSVTHDLLDELTAPESNAGTAHTAVQKPVVDPTKSGQGVT